MSAAPARPIGRHWPSEVVSFAGRHEVTAWLDPLRQTLERQFPTASCIATRVEEDPEIRDDCHIVFEVQVPRVDIADFAAAKKRWHEELFRLVPGPSVCCFRLNLVRVP